MIDEINPMVMYPSDVSLRRPDAPCYVTSTQPDDTTNLPLRGQNTRGGGEPGRPATSAGSAGEPKAESDASRPRRRWMRRRVASRRVTLRQEAQ